MWLFLLFQVDTCMISGIFVAFAENSLCKIKINGDSVLAIGYGYIRIHRKYFCNKKQQSWKPCIGRIKSNTCRETWKITTAKHIPINDILYCLVRISWNLKKMMCDEIDLILLTAAVMRYRTYVVRSFPWEQGHG